MDIHLVEDEQRWAHAQHIRHVVFIEGQDCPPEEEWDAWDAESRHLVGYVEGEPVAVSRWRVVEKAGQAWAKLERFAVMEAARGRGLGKAMIQATLDDARAAGHRRFVLHAQAHLERLYAGFGFEAYGERFDEVGIPHVRMRLVE